VPEYEVCRLDQLHEGRGRPARVAGYYLAVFLVDGRVHVLDNQCAHVGSPLAGGAVDDGCVVCPWHGWRYRLATGDLATAFGDRPGVAAHQAWVEDGTVKVRLEGAMPD
jgi:nitrite reductase/ring-hydroxylating ferredoxin subunit